MLSKSSVEKTFHSKLILIPRNCLSLIYSKFLFNLYLILIQLKICHHLRDQFNSLINLGLIDPQSQPDQFPLKSDLQLRAYSQKPLIQLLLIHLGSPFSHQVNHNPSRPGRLQSFVPRTSLDKQRNTARIPMVILNPNPDFILKFKSLKLR